MAETQRSSPAPQATSAAVACKRAAAALKKGLYFRFLEQDFVRYTIDCIIEMASGNRFAALADEAPNQATTAEKLALILAPCELIKAAEAFGLQRLRRCYLPLQCQDVAVPLQSTLLTRFMLIRVLCVCATATAAAQHLASASPRGSAGHDLQLRWAGAILRRVFGGCRSRIRVCLCANNCACFRSSAHAYCSIIWTF
jgi:hypothetical protein